MMNETPNETTWLLATGSAQMSHHPLIPEPILTIRRGPPRRIHFLDNLRATLTILLILHHAVLETAHARSQREVSRWQILPLELFTAVNKSFLWSFFFFVSGCSTAVSLSSKRSDFSFFISRTFKIGIPALVYTCFGQVFLFLPLAFGLGQIFGSYTFICLSGPVAYVFVLLIFDYIYLFIRWIRRCFLPAVTPPSSNSRIFNSLVPTSQPRFYGVSAFFICLLLNFTFLSCIGIHLPARILFFIFPYDYPGPDVPVSYITAYLAGIHFTSIRGYLTISLKHAYTALFFSLSLAYLSMAIAQHLSPSLSKYIEIDLEFDDTFFFLDGGFNLHTVFFTIWSAFVFFAIPVSIISIFTHARSTTHDWGFWTRHTYLQTYINMIPILTAIFYLQNVHNLLLKSVLVGILGTAGSWVLALIAAVLWRCAARRFPRQML